MLPDHKTNRTVRELYDDNWEKFKGSLTVELDFLGRTPEQQARLNRFKLWSLEQGNMISLAGKDILEFGAGHGRLALEFPSFASYTGIDISPNLVQIGEARLAQAGLADRARLVACDCLEYDGSEAVFDIVCSLGMFEYLADPAAVLRKMTYHLKPGGALFFDVHYSSPLYDQIRQLRWKMGIKKGGKRHLFSRKQLVELCHSAGLTDVRLAMREYPFLGNLYAVRGWNWALDVRNWLAARPSLNLLGINCFVFAIK